ncbi:hypothetical protein PR003_g22934 [Phytophthora rubi]|uniref:Timeless N-terminal domain-containing protein n=1 Tax=Phytophthora rubi TaxID=129364 RepID=A0A6A4D3N2_9STRA|nr:hypothetical protein PR002_g22581 [Phytophthora rubi]KAE8989525.1 hypothetical protein PR001_g21751 [Phytophthora rubi]KAE9299670.1 hypothetical protein PR003_g22934 [Phytophthora rubi]
MSTATSAANGSARAADPPPTSQRDDDLEDFGVSSSDEDAAASEPQLDASMMDELLLVCSNLGMLRVPTPGEAPVLLRGEDCEQWIHDLQRALRRDHAKHKLVAKQLGQWKILQKKLLPLLVHHQHDWALVFSVLKVLVMLTMKPSKDSTNVARQLQYLRQYKHEFLRLDVIPILMTILVDPLSRKGSARTAQDYLNMEIVLTLLRNLLAIPNEDPRVVTSTTAHLSHLQEDLICTLHEEDVYEMILLFAQDIESQENREWNLLIMEMLDLTLDCSQPKSVVAYAKKQLTGEGRAANATSVGSSLPSRQAGGDLLATLNSEKKASALHHSGSRRHSNFGGVLTMVGPTGRTTVLSDFSKTVYDQVPQAAKKPVSRRRGKKNAAPVTDIHEIFGGKGKVTESDERTMRVLQEICDSIVSKSYFQLTNSLKTEFRRGSNKLISTDRLQYFHLVWFLTTYHRFKVQTLKSHYKHQLKAVQKKTTELQNALDFTTPPPPTPAKPDYDEKAVLSTLDMFSFNFVLQSIENYATMKNYHGMTISVQLLAEMMAYLAELTSSDDPRFQRIADSLQHKIFYERDFLDRLPVLLKTWSPGLFPKAYVVDVVTLTHLVFKVLDSQGTIKVLSRRKAYLDKNRKKKKRGDGESKEGEDSDGSSTDEEETERQAQLVMEMQRKEADFDVRKYFSGMVSSDTTRMYCSLLADYRENGAKVNHYIHSFFYRTKHFQIYQQEEWTMQPMLFNIHVLLLFNKMLQDAYIQRLPEYKNFLDFIRGVVRDFFSLADKNNLLFVEALLRQPYPSKSCMMIQRNYDPIDSMSKSKSEAVALGRDKRIEAINELRRHRIALDHEELEGEAEFQFTLEPSDFQSTSLVDKEGQEEDGEAEFNAEDASVNSTESASAAKPKPKAKRKAPMSRAATERAKNWSKVEDRYLAKVFMKYRHLPSVYEVISYEDMFQERDRTPEQIERRVKYLKLHRKTHDSSDEEENNQSNSEGEQNGEQEESTRAVRESRLERDFATLDTAQPRRRLRRGADLSDEDSDDDMLLGGTTQAVADPAQSANTGGASTSEEPATVPNEEVNDDSATEVQTSTANDNESQSQDLGDTQVLEDSLDIRRESQTEQPTEAEVNQELDVEEATSKDPEASSTAPANVTPAAAEDSAMTGDELPNAETVAAETEAAALNVSQELENPDGGAADVQSLKRSRNTEDADDEAQVDTPAKKIHRAEAEEPDADASASEQ